MRLDRFITAKHDELALLRNNAETILENAAMRREQARIARHTLPPRFADALKASPRAADVPHVIAEFKRASPSKGDILLNLEPEMAAHEYAQGGASCLSVLTEEQYFKGSVHFLERMTAPRLPLLRKDFLFDPLQIAATANTSASALLLIVRLTPDVHLLRTLREQAESYGLDAVVEIFDAEDLNIARDSGARIIQVNARNLETFSINRSVALELAQKHHTPNDNEIWIAASGIDSPTHLREAKQAGYEATLIGTSLMDGGSLRDSLRFLFSLPNDDKNEIKTFQSLLTSSTANHAVSQPLRTVHDLDQATDTKQTTAMHVSKPLLKVCGLRRQEDLDCAQASCVDCCGFIFADKSPRYITPTEAATLQSGTMQRVGVFTTHDVQTIVDTVRTARLDVVQLHGEQPLEITQQITQTLGELDANNMSSVLPCFIRVLWPERYAKTAELQAEMQKHISFCHAFLLDAGTSGGGSGTTITDTTLQILENLQSPLPWFLAGGLTLQNVTAFLQYCKPNGLDFNSGLESSAGCKDQEQLKRLKMFF